MLIIAVQYAVNNFSNNLLRQLCSSRIFLYRNGSVICYQWQNMYPKYNFRVPGITQKMVEMQVGQGFSLFFAQTFAIFVDFSVSPSNFGVLHFEKSSNMAKIWQQMMKSLLQLALNPFLHGTTAYGYPQPEFWVPICSQLCVFFSSSINCTTQKNLFAIFKVCFYAFGLFIYSTPPFETLL